MLKRRARSEVAQLGLHHRPQIAGRVVAKFNDFAQRTLEKNHHAAPNLSCGNCHRKKSSPYLIEYISVIGNTPFKESDEPL